MHVNTLCVKYMNNLLSLVANKFPKDIKPVSKMLCLLNI